MHCTLAYLSLLIQHAALIRTMPATTSSNTNRGTSLIQLNGMTPGFPNITSGPPPGFCSKNNLNAGFQTHYIYVPGTTTILIMWYCPDLPIHRDMMHDTVSTAWIHLNNGLHTYGDTTLLSHDDPYTTPVVQHVNCTVTLNSFRTPGTAEIPTRLTYQTSLNAVQGVFDFLYRDHHDGSAVSQILDPGLTGDMIRIGLVSVSPMEGSVDMF